MTPLRLAIALFGAASISACSGAVGVQPGDAVVTPELDPPRVAIVVLAADDLVTIPASVSVDGVEVAGVDRASPTFEWASHPVRILVTAPGFVPWDFTLEAYPDGGSIEFRLEPVVLSGLVTTAGGRPLPGVQVKLGSARDTTDNEGRYALERAIPGDVELARPAWEDAAFEWDGEVTELDMAMEPSVVRALRVAPEDVVDQKRWNKILSLLDTTAVDALAIDLKTEDGTVVYPTEVEIANAIGAVSSYFDIDTLVATAKAHDAYLIGRIGVFQDNFYAAAEPDSAVRTADGSLWRSNNGFAWLDASDPTSYEYSISLAEEACRLGFDEIQFDYVSYPFGGDISDATFDGAYNQEVRVTSIAAFLTRAYAVLHPKECAVSATILGIVLESDKDEGVGQLPGTMSRIVDVLSPTLYTTNYGSGWKGIEDPSTEAVRIVSEALQAGASKLDGHAYLRPWLQTWAISTADQRAVQSVAEEDGMGWLLWSNNAGYSAGALPRP